MNHLIHFELIDWNRHFELIHRKLINILQVYNVFIVLCFKCLPIVVMVSIWSCRLFRLKDRERTPSLLSSIAQPKWNHPNDLLIHAHMAKRLSNTRNYDPAPVSHHAWEILSAKVMNGAAKGNWFFQKITWLCSHNTSKWCWITLM